MISKLEARRLLAAIEGNVFDDQDGDGLRDFFEAPLDGVTLFLDENDNGLFEEGEATAVTDSAGNYRFDEVDPGNYYLYFRPDSIGDGTALLAPTSPGLAGRVIAPSTFDIDLVFIDRGLDDAARTIIETAANIWEQAVIGDLPDVMTEEFGMIDDVRIEIRSQESDGPNGFLAFANYSERRDDADGGLPFTGFVNIDPADVTTSQGFVETVVHEFGHVLGIGTLWEPFGLTDVFPGDEENYDDINFAAVFGLDSPPDDTPFLAGDAARREKNTLFGIEPGEPGFDEFPILEGLIPGPVFNPDTGIVEVQRQALPGSSYLHWDEETYRNELMTPLSEGGFTLQPGSTTLAPLSRLTLGGLEDLGYNINYAAADPFGPLAIGALPGDFDDLGFDLRPFRIGIGVTAESSDIDDANFGVRANRPPSPFFFNADPFVAAGQPLSLLAEIDRTTDPDFTGDLDFRDRVSSVAFYRETNGTPGLQTPGDVRRGTASSADTFLVQDFVAGDGFSVDVDTAGLVEGVETYYAAAFDAFGAFTVREASSRVVSAAITSPEKPTDLRVLGSSTQSFTVVFDDNAESEEGYILQIADNATDFTTFDVAFADGREEAAFDFVRQVFLPPQDGTARYQTTVELQSATTDSENTSRAFRIRAVNTAGSSAFAGRVTASTLGPGEIVIDDDDPARVTFTGDFVRVVDDGARALSYASGTTGSVTYDPPFGAENGPAEGTYAVFANVPDVGSLGETRVSVFSTDGNSRGSVVLDPAQRGAEILIGTFRFREGDRIAFSSSDGGNAFADTVRFLPTDQVS
ncbi:MAG: SdrD B-like domain-containing protein [Planctomycetota bacterium]